MISVWLDQRDIPNAKFGKTAVPGCTCTQNETCSACMRRCADRNAADRSNNPLPAGGLTRHAGSDELL